MLLFGEKKFSLRLRGAIKFYFFCPLISKFCFLYCLKFLAMTIRQLRHVIDPPKGFERPVFDIAFVKQSSGEIIRGHCSCTSSNHKNDTFNIKFIESGEIRTIAALSIIEFNNKEVTP